MLLIPARVLIIGPSAQRIIGGQEVEATLLVRNWKGDSDAEVAFLPSNPALPKWMRLIENIPYIRTATRLPIYVLSVWRATARVDVVHIFSASYSSFLLACLPAWLISRWQRKRCVLNYHTARHWQKFANSTIVGFVLRHTDAVVVPSHYLAAKFEAIGFSVSVIPNIVADQFHYRPRTQLRPRIICTRNLSSDYGIEVVIIAFSIVQARYPGASLYLIGDGPLRHDLEAQVRDRGLSGVEFCGKVPNDQMPEWYERADIFLNASFLDNAPLSILEAFACGLPVVTTAAGGIPLMANHEETALVGPVGDAQTLADQVLRLLREPELAAKLARQAHEQLASHSWSLVRVKWLEVYAAKGGAKPPLT
jgi:glycosyltransferase involved in cell wall biosynthesis